MKNMFVIAAILLTLLVLAGITWFFLLGRKSAEAQAPGMVAGRLAPCPDKPNCVSSEFPGDTAHYIPFIGHTGVDSELVWALAHQAVREEGGILTSENENYRSYTFTSSLFRFVDDLELRNDPESESVHIRSASRVGHSDMGVNRKRVQSILDRFGVLLNEN